VAQLLVVNPGDVSAQLQNNIILNTAPDDTVTITATRKLLRNKQTTHDFAHR
jgi:hypothetical protein